MGAKQGTVNFLKQHLASSARQDMLAAAENGKRKKERAAIQESKEVTEACEV